VIEELAALAACRLVRPELFFCGRNAGAEVDLLIVEGLRILPVEIKLGAAIDHHSIAGLRQCMKISELRRGMGGYNRQREAPPVCRNRDHSVGRAGSRPG